MLWYRTNAGASSRGIPRKCCSVMRKTFIAVPQTFALEAMPKVRRFQGDHIPMNVVYWGDIAVRLLRWKLAPIVISDHWQPSADSRERCLPFNRGVYSLGPTRIRR